ncbi:hypothetical protein CYMTET_3572, partial [Cymbomonas tetramitiformis]
MRYLQVLSAILVLLAFAGSAASTQTAEDRNRHDLRSLEAAQEAFALIDKDGDDCLSFTEFLAAYSALADKGESRNRDVEDRSTLKSDLPRPFPRQLTTQGEVACNGTTVDVQIRTANFGSEISWKVDHHCQSGEVTYGDNLVYNTSCCFLSNTTSILVTCQDSYGDGWHGGYLVFLGNRVACEDFDSGHRWTTSVPL